MQSTASALLNRLLARGKFRHVQVLLLLAELGSVQRPADAIGMTQSSITQTLAYLEELLEARLFERHARGVRPTPACMDLLPVARQLMQGIANSAEVITARQNEGEGVARIFGSAAAIHGLLLKALPAFSDRHPGIQVHLGEAEGEDQLLTIARGEVDFAVCRRPAVIPEGWEFHPLVQDQFAIVCRADHRLARARSPTWANLAQETWLLLPAGVAARRVFDGLSTKFPHPPKTYPVVTRAIALVWWLLRERELLALLPLNLVRPLIDSGALTQLRIGDAVRIEPIGLLQPQAGMGSAAARLSDFLRQYVAPGTKPARK